MTRFDPKTVCKAALVTSALTAAVALLTALIPDLDTVTAQAYRAGVEDRPILTTIRR